MDAQMDQLQRVKKQDLSLMALKELMLTVHRTGECTPREDDLAKTFLNNIQHSSGKEGKGRKEEGEEKQ